MGTDKVTIKVFVTKTFKFRAKIKESGKPAYEVTIGGEKWKEGVGRKYAGRIKQSCQNILKHKLVRDYQKTFGTML